MYVSSFQVLKSWELYFSDYSSLGWKREGNLLGGSLLGVPSKGADILWPIPAFKMPHISALGQLKVQGSKLKGPLVWTMASFYTSVCRRGLLCCQEILKKKTFLKMSWRWFHGSSRSQISQSNCLFILFRYFESCYLTVSMMTNKWILRSLRIKRSSP